MSRFAELSRETGISESSSEIGRNSNELLSSMFDMGFIRLEDTRFHFHSLYPDVPPSPIYFEYRAVHRKPELTKIAGEIYAECISGVEFDLLADVPVGSTAFTETLSQKLGTGFVTPRLKEKGYGGGSRVDGLLPGDVGKRVLIVDDVVSSGESEREAASILREEGVIISDAVALMEYGFGGKERLARGGIRLHFAYTIMEALESLRDSSRISVKEFMNAILRIDNIATTLKPRLKG